MRGRPLLPLGSSCSPDTELIALFALHPLSPPGPPSLPPQLLEYVGKGKSIVDVGLAQARRPLSTRSHYFEVEIVDPGEKCYIALGLARKVGGAGRRGGGEAGGSHCAPPPPPPPSRSLRGFCPLLGLPQKPAPRLEQGIGGVPCGSVPPTAPPLGASGGCGTQGGSCYAWGGVPASHGGLRPSLPQMMGRSSTAAGLGTRLAPAATKGTRWAAASCSPATTAWTAKVGGGLGGGG